MTSAPEQCEDGSKGYLTVSGVGGGVIDETISTSGQEVKKLRMAEGTVNRVQDCYGVRVLNCKKVDSDPDPDPDYIMDHGIRADDLTPWGHWTARNIPTGYCDFGQQNNITWAAATFRDRKGEGGPDPDTACSTRFEGRCLSPMPGPNPVPVPPPTPQECRCSDLLPESTDGVSQGPFYGQAAVPTAFENGWVHYSHLDVTRPFWGSRLTLGENLRGQVIALAATEVAWRYAAGINAMIRSPLGNQTPAPEGWDWAYPGLPQYGLIVRQRSEDAPMHAITSDRQDKPMIIEVKPDENIFVVANGSPLLWDRRNYAGGFDLWVKVIA